MNEVVLVERLHKGRNGRPIKSRPLRPGTTRDAERIARQVNPVLRAMARHKLSSQGKNWLVQILDPFHDTVRAMAGYPDTDGSNTFCRNVTISKTVTHDDSLGEGLWDLHIVSLPELTSSRFNRDNYLAAWAGQFGEYARSLGQGNFTDPNGETPQAFDYWPIMWSSQPTGMNTFPVLPTTDNVLNIFDGFEMDTYLDGDTRLIAAGFEVHNTTPQNFRGGQLTVYRMPQENQITSFGIAQSDVAHNNSPSLGAVVSASPPQHQSLAMQYRGSTQWNADEGAYIPLTLSTTENPLSVRRNMQRMFVDGPGANNTACFGAIMDFKTVYGPATNGGPNVLTIIPDNACPCQPAPWNSSGCYLTGLDPSSSIVITAKFYFETAPYGDSNLLGFAYPSSPFDPVALELYSRISASVPPGVKANANASGDYWNLIANLISAAAPAIGVALSPFTGGLSAPIGAGIGTIARVASGLMAKGSQSTEANNRFVPKGEPVVTAPKRKPKVRVKR